MRVLSFEDVCTTLGVYICVCVYVCAYVCVYVCAYVCLCVFVNLFVSISESAASYIYFHFHTIHDQVTIPVRTMGEVILTFVSDNRQVMENKPHCRLHTEEQNKSPASFDLHHGFISA